MSGIDSRLPPCRVPPPLHKRLHPGALPGGAGKEGRGGLRMGSDGSALSSCCPPTRLCRDSQRPRLELRPGPAVPSPRPAAGAGHVAGGSEFGDPRDSGGGGVSPPPRLLEGRVKARSPLPRGEPRSACPPRGYGDGRVLPRTRSGGGGGGDGWRGRERKAEKGMPSQILDAGSRNLRPPGSHVQNPPAQCLVPRDHQSALVSLQPCELRAGGWLTPTGWARCLGGV